jgi:hypothetical protein
MSKKKDITTEDLNNALWHISRKARRENKALGLDTLYEKDGYLIKLDAAGEEHKLEKLEKKKKEPITKVITF